MILLLEPLSGAMNGAILVSHVAKNGSWQVSIEKLNAFWEHVSTDPDLRYWFPYIPDKKSWISYWDMQQGMYPNSASGELGGGDITLQRIFYVLEFHAYICQNFLHYAYH